MIYFREKSVKRKNDWIRNYYPDLEVEKENKENKIYCWCWCWNLYAGVIGIVRLSDGECESGRERQNESKGQSDGERGRQSERDGENEGGGESDIENASQSGNEIEGNSSVAFFVTFSSLRLNFFLLKP